MKSNLLNSIIAGFLILICNSQPLSASSISYEQMSNDLGFLADDKLAGRAAFTPQIDQAAEYIAKRFKEIGLKPLQGESDFKQSFTIYQISSGEIQCQLNSKTVEQDNLMLLTSRENLSWNQLSDLKVEVISAEQDFREAISLINQKNSDLLVLVDPAHFEIFSRYRQYFSKLQSKFKINQGRSALFILSETKTIDSISVTAKNEIVAQQLSNVVGVLPGNQQAEEKIIFSAHYDHLGSNPALKDDTIYNGADDDATGTTAVINLASYFSRQKNNQRSLIFVAFTAEELGGFGSQYFSEQMEPDSIVAMINIEMIGKPSKFGAGKLWMTGFERSDLAKILNKNLTDTQILADPYLEQNLFYRSDNATLARLGVPAHSFSSSQIDIDQHYHQVSDELTTIDLNSMQQVIETLAAATQNLVNGNDTPSRLKTGDIRAKGHFF